MGNLFSKDGAESSKNLLIWAAMKNGKKGETLLEDKHALQLHHHPGHLAYLPAKICHTEEKSRIEHPDD